MSHPRAVSLMILVAFLWSIAGVVTRHLDTAQSFEVTFWRSLFNAAALFIALTVIRGPRLWRDLINASWRLWLSGTCWAVMFTAFMIALTLTTVANVLVTMALAPLITALFSRLFLKHRLPARTWSAITLAGLGIGWMFGREVQTGMSLLGTTVALAVPVAAAINWTLLQHSSRNLSSSADARPSRTPDMLPAILIGAALSALATLPFAWPLSASAHDMRLLALLGIVQLATPCLLVVRLSRELPAPEIALLGLLEVVFGVLWAWLGADEQLAESTLVGGLLVLGALIANEVLAGFSRRAPRLEQSRH